MTSARRRALAYQRCELEGRILGYDRQMLVDGDLADTDDRDGMLAHALRHLSCIKCRSCWAYKQSQRAGRGMCGMLKGTPRSAGFQSVLR